MTSFESADIRIVEDDGVITVTFTRDSKLNAVNPEMLDGLRFAATELEERPDVKVLLITAEGRYFTAGIDIAHMKGRAADEDGVVRMTSIRRERRRLHSLFDRFESIEKPVVVAFQSACLGFGMEMACSADFRLSADNVTFSMPEIANLAVLPAAGGISRMTRLVGPHWARYITMAGKKMDARRMYEIGYLHEIHPPDELPEKARQFARDLAALPGEALGLAKVAIDAASVLDRGTSRDVDRIANTALLLSDEHNERIARYRK